MGLNSCSESTLALITPTGNLSCLAIPFCWAASCGTNSCRGGSSRRIVTGNPFMALKMPSKSLRWIGLSLANAFLRPFSSSARIISRTARMRSPSKNMCSVRQRPMPSAPKRRATSESCGVSALARTLSFRALSAHCISVPNSFENLASLVGVWPSMTSPDEPSIDTQSPFLTVLPPALNKFLL